LRTVGVRLNPRSWEIGGSGSRTELQKDAFSLDVQFKLGTLIRGDLMPIRQTDLAQPMPSIVPSDVPSLSDDECLVRLAQAVEERDSEHLDEVARLIGRLAVTIE
jgi:hypothetical protein